MTHDRAPQADTTTETPRLAIVKPRVKAQARSKITNGKLMLDNIDGRSAGARRYRDIWRGLQREFQVTSDSDEILLKQCAILCVVSERLQAQIVTGELSDIVTAKVITNMAGQLNRILSRLRLATNQWGPAPPSLHQHLAEYGQTLDVVDDDDEEGDAA